MSKQDWSKRQAILLRIRILKEVQDPIVSFDGQTFHITKLEPTRTAMAMILVAQRLALFLRHPLVVTIIGGLIVAYAVARWSQ